MDWTYEKDGGLNYPVAPGDLWQVGAHVIGCGDLESGDVLRDVLALVGAPKLVIVDPPWNAGNARSFRTKARADGPQGKPVVMTALLTRAFRPAADARCPMHVEMGVKETPATCEVIEQLGGKIVRIDPVTYYGRHPCSWIYATFADGPTVDVTFSGLDEDACPAKALTAHGTVGDIKPGDVILDPCAGRGLMLISAARVGYRAVGHELHPNRVSVTLTKLATFTGTEPERIT